MRDLIHIHTYICDAGNAEAGFTSCSRTRQGVHPFTKSVDRIINLAQRLRYLFSASLSVTLCLAFLWGMLAKKKRYRRRYSLKTHSNIVFQLEEHVITFALFESNAEHIFQKYVTNLYSMEQKSRTIQSLRRIILIKQQQRRKEIHAY